MRSQQALRLGRDLGKFHGLDEFADLGWLDGHALRSPGVNAADVFENANIAQANIIERSQADLDSLARVLGDGTDDTQILIVEISCCILLGVLPSKLETFTSHAVSPGVVLLLIWVGEGTGFFRLDRRGLGAKS